MSIQSVLRQMGDDNADRLADAWADFDHRLEHRNRDLQLEISRANQKSTASVWIAGLTLAGFLGSALFIGIELGGLKERVGALEQKAASVERQVLDSAKVVEGVSERIDELQSTIESFIEANNVDDNRRQIVRGAVDIGGPLSDDFLGFFDETNRVKVLNNYRIVEARVLVFEVATETTFAFGMSVNSPVRYELYINGTEATGSSVFEPGETSTRISQVPAGEHRISLQALGGTANVDIRAQVAVALRPVAPGNR